MKKTKSIFSKILTVLVICVAMFSFTGCGSTKVNMNDYITVSFEGYNGYAKPRLTVDTDSLNRVIKDKADFNKKLISLDKDNNFWELMISGADLSDLITVKFAEDYQNLSNGDVVRVEIGMDDFIESVADFDKLQKTIKVDFKPLVLDYVVSGLEEAKTMDIIGLLKDYIVFTGANGAGGVKVDIPADFYEEIDGYIFTPTDSGSLSVVRDHKDCGNIRLTFQNVNGEYVNSNGVTVSNGDELKVGVSDFGFKYNVEQEGYIIPENYTVTVSGLGEYISSPDQITEEIKTEVDNQIYRYVAERRKPIDHFPNFKIVGYKWANLKSNAVSHNLAAEKNFLCVMCENDISYYSAGTITKYFSPTILLYDDGTYKVDVGTAHNLEWYPLDKYDLTDINF